MVQKETNPKEVGYENFKGEGVSKAKTFKGKPEPKLEFPARLGCWVSNQKAILRRDIDVFWNNTIMVVIFSALLSHQPSEHQSFPPLCMEQIGYIALAWTQLKHTDGKSTSPPVK